MAVIAWPQGNTHTALPITLQSSTGSPLNLTGEVSINLKYRPAISSGIYLAMTGSATVVSPTNGQFIYNFAASDIAIPGQYKLVVAVNYGTGDNWFSYEQDFIVTPTT